MTTGEKFWKRRLTANHTTTTPPPPAGFRLVRYFTVASLAAFVLVTAPLLYFERWENDHFNQMLQEQNAFFAQMRNGFVQRHDAAALAYLLRVHEAGITNLTRLFANALWERDFAPFVAKVQRIPADQCRAIADVKDAGGTTVQPREKQACSAGIGKQIMASPEFRALDAKVSDMMQKSTVFKIKVYDLRGITVYSSEHNQIGEDNFGNAGWQSAAAGKSASQLTHRGKFSAFEGALQNRGLIEIYLPLLAPGSEKIVAVFEVYSDVTQFLDQIKSTSSQIQKLSAEIQAQAERAATANRDKVDANANLLLAIVLGLLALLYCALLLIVRHGQRIIDKEKVEIERAESALLRQKDFYNVLSQSNKAIVHVVERDELFTTVCRIAVEHGRFRFAWIGLLDKDSQRLKPVARYGEDAGYIDQLDISGDAASDTRRGLTGRALLSGAYMISNDFLNDPAMAPWHEAARRAGVRASAKFPIRQGGAVIGAINLYAGEPEFFTDELVAALEEMANDASFALDNYARETARKQAVEALRASEAKFRLLAEENLAGVVIVQDGRLKYVNPAITQMLGYLPEDLLGASSVLEFVAAEDRTLVRENLGRCQDGKEQSISYVFRGRKKDGSSVYLEAFGSRTALDNRFAVISTVLDISERKQAEQALHDNAERLRGLSRRLIAAEDTARRNINRELHDRIGQKLAALNINLTLIRSQLPQESLRVVGARLQDTQTLLEETAAQTRDIMADLHPPALDDFGLLAALRTYVELFGARLTVPITVHGEDLAPRLSLAAEMALFRVAQGALANAVAHASAKRIQVLLAATPDRVTLTIADDGVGFDVARAAFAHVSWGLSIMRERAEAVDATLRIETAPGRGTRVVVEIKRGAV